MFPYTLCHIRQCVCISYDCVSIHIVSYKAVCMYFFCFIPYTFIIFPFCICNASHIQGPSGRACRRKSIIIVRQQWQYMSNVYGSSAACAIILCTMTPGTAAGSAASTGGESSFRSRGTSRTSCRVRTSRRLS